MLKKRSKQRAEYLQKQYEANPKKKKASVRDNCKADLEKKKATAGAPEGIKHWSGK